MYLAAQSLSCSTQEQQLQLGNSSLWHVGSSSLTRGSNLGAPALGVWGLSHWATSEVVIAFLSQYFLNYSLMFVFAHELWC